MLFEVRDGTKVPIFEQIVNQVVFAVASGALEVGELIPSVRDLAVRLRINPNTVARAYQELEKDEVLAARRGLGMEVTADAPGLCKSRRRTIVQGRIREALREAVSSALEPEAIRKLVEEELHRANGYSRKALGGGEP